jgi:hypothetical protein
MFSKSSLYTIDTGELLKLPLPHQMTGNNNYMELQQQLFEYFDTVLLDFDTIDEMTLMVKNLMSKLDDDNTQMPNTILD